MTIRLPKLRESAKDAPHCMNCGQVNIGGNLVLAHSNSLSDGRGIGHKSHDVLAAVLCPTCHDHADGRSGGLSKDEKRELLWRANRKTIVWWVEEGFLK